MRGLAAVVAIGVAAFGVGASQAGALAPGEVTGLIAVPGTSTPLQATANASSLTPNASRPVSGDGRFVVFTSTSDAMAADDDDRVANVYRRDTIANVTILVSRGPGLAGAPADRNSSLATISDDGDRVAFVTTAALVAADTNDAEDVYVRDVAAGTTVLASRASGANGVISAPAAIEGVPEISGDGSHVVFATSASLVGVDDDNGSVDAYLRELDTPEQDTILVSRNEPADAPMGGVTQVAVNGNGGLVAFVSTAQGVALDADASADAYARAVGPGVTDLVSRTGATNSNGVVLAVSVDTSGNRIVFDSTATNLPGDTDGSLDVFMHTVGAGTTEVIDPVAAPGGSTCTGACRAPVISSLPGNEIAITFVADDAVLSGGTAGVVLQRRLNANTTTVVSRGDGPSGAVASVLGFGAARGGDSVAFDTGTDAVSDEDVDLFRNVFLRRPATQRTLFVSRGTGTGAVPRGAGTALGNGGGGRVFSTDGRFVAFGARAPGLVPTDLLGFVAGEQVYRRDLVTNEVLLVSRRGGIAADDEVGSVAISADGRFVAFSVEADALAASFGATDEDQVYRHDAFTGETILVSRADGALGAPATTGAGSQIGMSADGDRIAFVSASPGLAAGQTNPDQQVFVRTISSARTELVSRGLDGLALAGGSFHPALSADGNAVVFATDSDALDGSVLTLDAVQVVVRDLATGETTVLSRSADGVLGTGGSTDPDISDDGRRIVFTSVASNLDPADADVGRSLYLADRAAGTLRVVGRADGVAGSPDQAAVGSPFISPDGRHVLWSTLAPLDAADTNVASDAYLRDTRLDITRRVSLGAGGVQLSAASPDGISADGRCVMFRSRDGAAAAGAPTSGDFTMSFVRAAITDCPVPPTSPPPPPLPPPAGPGAPPPVADTVAPVLSNVSLTRKRFRVAGLRVRALPGRRLAPAGSVLRLRLSESARVRLVFERRAQGKRVNGRCLAPIRARAKRPNCVRFIAAGALTRPTLAAGARRIAITGRIGRRALRPGAYRLSVTAIDAPGNRSAVRRVTFTIVRR